LFCFVLFLFLVVFLIPGTDESRVESSTTGHVGVNYLATLELARQGRPWLASFTAFVTVTMFVFVLVVRVHYSIDCITAVLAAYSSVKFAEYWLPETGGGAKVKRG
jgi:hypothetical protein